MHLQLLQFYSAPDQESGFQSALRSWELAIEEPGPFEKMSVLGDAFALNLIYALAVMQSNPEQHAERFRSLLERTPDPLLSSVFALFGANHIGLISADLIEELRRAEKWEAVEQLMSEIEIECEVALSAPSYGD